MAQLSAAINYLSYFPAATDVFPSLTLSTSMTSYSMIFERTYQYIRTYAQSHVMVLLRTTKSNLIFFLFALNPS